MENKEIIKCQTQMLISHYFGLNSQKTSHKGEIMQTIRLMGQIQEIQTPNRQSNIDVEGQFLREQKFKQLPCVGDQKFQTHTQKEQINFCVDSTYFKDKDGSFAAENVSTPAQTDITHIFTDGSCLNNGKGNASAGIGIYFGKDHPMNRSEALKVTQIHTNNSAELIAIKKAIQLTDTNKSIIYSDSQYSIDCVTRWHINWELYGWTTAENKQVQNKSLIQKIVQLLEQNPQISLIKVKAHENGDDFYSVGNREADKLANQGRKKGERQMGRPYYFQIQHRVQSERTKESSISKNKRHHEDGIKESSFSEMTEGQNLQQFKRAKKELIQKQKTMLSLDQTWSGFISEKYVQQLPILVNSQLEIGITKHGQLTDDTIFKPLFPQYYQQKQNNYQEDAFTLNQTKVWFHWSEQNDTFCKLRIITNIKNQDWFKSSWQKTTSGVGKLKPSDAIYPEAIYAFDIEISTIKNVVCLKKDLVDNVACVEMYIFLRNPCKSYRMMQFIDSKISPTFKKYGFGRVGSILKVPNSEFVNSWNRKQVIRLEFVTKQEDFDLFHKKCSQSQVLKSFSITKYNLQNSITRISSEYLQDFYCTIDEMAALFEKQVVRNAELKFQLQFMILCMLSKGMVSIHNLREQFINYLTTSYGRNTYQAKKAAAVVEVIIQMRNNLKDKDDLYLIELFNKIYNDEEHTKFKQDKHLQQNVNVFREHQIYKSSTIDIYEIPQIAQSNHVVRKFIKDQDMFIKVYFVDESGKQGFYCLKQDKQFTNFVYNTIVDGFYIGQNRCDFVGCSPSQLKMHSIKFYAATVDNKYTIEQIRDSFEVFQQFSQQTSVSQTMLLLARMGQLFTDSKYICDIEEPIQQIDDIERNNFIFSDGCGFMSLPLCEQIWVHQKLNFLPTTVQIRVGGCKGILILKKELHLQDKVIQVRNSQIKFNHTSNAFNLVRIAQFSQGFLNSQIIIFLEQLGVPQKVFLNLLEDQCNQITMLTQSVNNYYTGFNIHQFCSVRYFSRAINLAIKHSKIKIFNDPCIEQIIHTLQLSLLGQIKDKQRILLKNSCNLMGIIDPYEVLLEGEVFIQICKNINAKKQKNKLQVIKTDVLVTRHPTPEMKDIRRLKAVHKDQLLQYVNVIIFSSKGQRPAQTEMANGDLDGDTYFIIYDEQIVQFITVGKIEDPSKQKEKIINVQHSAEYKDFSNLAKLATSVVKFIRHDLMRGSYGLLQAYFERFGADHEDTVWLSQFYVQCIDLSKRPNIPNNQKFFDLHAKFGSQYPDYVRKINTYESPRIAGVIFRKMQDYVQNIAYKRNRWQNSIKLEYQFDETLITHIYNISPYLEQLYAQIVAPFTQDLKNLMLQHNLCCEGELFIFQQLLKRTPGVDFYDVDQLISNTLDFLIIKYKEKLKYFQHINNLDLQTLSQGLYFVAYYYPDIKLEDNQISDDCLSFINKFKNSQSTQMLQPITEKECEIWKEMQDYDTYSGLLSNIQTKVQSSKLQTVLKFTKLLSIPWLLAYKSLIGQAQVTDELRCQVESDDYYSESGEEELGDTCLPTWF